MKFFSLMRSAHLKHLFIAKDSQSCRHEDFFEGDGDFFCKCVSVLRICTYGNRELITLMHKHESLKK